jgi:acetyl-CoA C-acetyltransferase
VRDVSIVGIGQIEVAEHWSKSLRHLAGEAVLAAMRDAGTERADALYVGNMLSGELTGQEHLGALVADFVNLRGIEAVKIEAACGSGGAAVRMGYLAVASGLLDVVIVVGVEKMTDQMTGITSSALAMAADADYEVVNGVSFVSLNALLMQRYMHEFGVKHEDFAGFPINAHKNAATNPYAMFQKAISLDTFKRAKMVAAPINLMDSSPIADGAAAVVLAPSAMAREFQAPSVRILGSANATDSLAIHDRRDPLFLGAAAISVQKAYRQAGVSVSDVNFFELHDAFSITAALSLEAAGFAERGRGAYLARDGEIGLEGRIPVCTLGGLKARGHPVGATGVYQVVEATLQLRGEAGPNQVKNARIGMTQNIGGSGATVITHILAAEK